ncbi:MAG TPA: thiamine pyrophosphate-dependent enzyme, partial [Burkholderiales bacterium]|nr:thiamine pyrophosphate-dependent enzyme [Burkholderiales bacterium]
LVGGQDSRFLHTDPILWGPVEQMARSVCKAVFGLNSQYDAAANIRRALRAALTPPYAPVALICPPDLLELEIDAAASAVTSPKLAGLDAKSAQQYAAFLTSARRAAIVAAEDVHWCGAAGALERLASALDLPVYAAPYTGVLPIAASSRQYAGYLPPSMKQISERLRDSDAVLFAGGRGLRTTLYDESQLLARIAWIGTDSSAQSAGGEYELALVADLAQSLEAIAAHAGAKSHSGAAQRQPLDLPPAKAGTLHPTRAIAALLGKFGDAIWFDESGLSTSDVRQWMNLPAGEYIVNGSGGIGWGLAASVGGAIARGDKRVVAAIGDGSALYASEALWTAQNRGTSILLVVLANRRYATLNEAASRLVGGALDSFTIEPPVLDFSGLAKLYGWNYASAASEEEMAAVLDRPGALKGNTLLELKLDPALTPVTASRHF